MSVPADVRAAGPDGPVALRQLALVSAVQILAIATWFAASAAAPALREEWQIGRVGEAMLTVGVQVGFVAGALVSAVTNLPDRVHPPRLMGLGAAVAGLATAGTALAGGPGVAVTLRVVTGMALALVYPVGMKVVVSWFADRRGLAVGVMIGALTVGTILPQLISGTLDEAWRTALVVSAALALLAALLQSRIHVGPLVTPTEGFHPRAVLDVWRVRAPRLANLGYLGHMWELYAVWTWAPAYLAASIAARDDAVATRATVGVVAFVALGLCGAVGCLVVGWLGDRVGRARAAATAMVVSGGCCLAAAAAYGGPLLVLVPLLMVWGAAVIADSAMFSACLGSVVDRRYVGTALTLQTALGFLLTVATIQLMPAVAEAAGWRVAVALLAPGPLLGALAMVRLTPLLPAPAEASGEPAG